MKPPLRSILITFISSAVCTGVGVVAGIWMAQDAREPNFREPNFETPCADAPLACAKRTAENRCGGPGKYRLVGKEIAGQRARFTFVCVSGEAI